MPPASLLEVRDVHVAYGAGVRALQGVSLQVNAGEVVALIGANGAGKTTLLKSIAGLVTPQAGEVSFDGQPIGAVDAAGTLLGFATYGVFRARPAYKYSVEHSVYVHKDCRGQGAGRALLQRIIEAAREQNYHVLVGGIDAENAASIALHRELGFTHAGTITQSGFKFGRWLDLAFYQLTLETPVNPVDG